MASTRRPLDAVAATPSGRRARDVARSALPTDGARRQLRRAQGLVTEVIYYTTSTRRPRPA